MFKVLLALTFLSALAPAGANAEERNQFGGRFIPTPPTPQPRPQQCQTTCTGTPVQTCTTTCY